MNSTWYNEVVDGTGIVWFTSPGPSDGEIVTEHGMVGATAAAPICPAHANHSHSSAGVSLITLHPGPLTPGTYKTMKEWVTLPTYAAYFADAVVIGVAPSMQANPGSLAYFTNAQVGAGRARLAVNGVAGRGAVAPTPVV